VQILTLRKSLPLALLLAYSALVGAAASDALARTDGLAPIISQHQGTFGGKRIDYQVVAGDWNVKNDAGEPIGTIYSFSYIQAKPPLGSRRPVTFVFNGGPGSSSAWLHLGIGPRIVSVNPTDARLGPPYTLKDNPDSPLVATDLVFIDPVGTGFSHVVGKGAPADFFGSNQDAQTIGAFIEHWLSEHGRWQSPKYLAGESYGTVRASLLTAVLARGGHGVALRGISVNGLIFIGHDGGLVPLDSSTRFQTNFTTMAASAWYHNRVDHSGRTFEQFIDAARTFASATLGPVLQKGNEIEMAEVVSVSQTMASFLGIPPGYLQAKRLRISSLEFARTLLADRGKEVSLFDARFTTNGKLPNDAVGLTPAGEGDVTDDALLSRITPLFAGAFHTYLQSELGVHTDSPYVLLADVESQWKNDGPRVDPGNTLVNAIRRDPDLKILFMGGWYDVIAGTVGAAEYASEKRLPPGRAEVKAYQSGHMCYLGSAGTEVGRDIATFITSTSSSTAHGSTEK
jgi:carboxypeptidase C (cathepsin A)